MAKNDELLQQMLDDGLSVKSSSDVIRVTPTITAEAYSANDVVGGVITLAGAVREAGGAGVLQSVVIVDRGNVGAALSLLLFRASPASALADNAPFAWGSGDGDKYLGRVEIAASDYATFAGRKVASVKNVGLVIAADATDLFAYLVCSGTPTYASQSDLTLHVGILRD